MWKEKKKDSMWRQQYFSYSRTKLLYYSDSDNTTKSHFCCKQGHRKIPNWNGIRALDRWNTKNPGQKKRERKNV